MEDGMTYLDKERNIVEGTYLKFEGMYIGEQNNPSCKENHNILITMQQSFFIAVLITI